jgi:hypothetical membrane protein
MTQSDSQPIWRRAILGRDPGGSASVEAVERPELLLVCGLAGVVGSLALVALAIYAQIVVPAHDPIAETISDLGDGPRAIWMDLGFYAYAGGLIGLAVGSAHAHLGRWGWSLGVLALVGLALVITLLGVYDDFHTQSVPPEAYTVHTRLTFALAPLYVIGPIGMAAGAARVARGFGPAFLGAAIAMAVFGPLFYLVPTSIDGLVERLLVIPGLVWTFSLSYILLARARS